MYPTEQYIVRKKILFAVIADKLLLLFFHLIKLSAFYRSFMFIYFMKMQHWPN